MSAAFAIFMEEARELIGQMEAILLRLEAGDADADDLPALFRCAHTIKGSAGMFGLDEVVRFTHVVESVLDELRSGAFAFCPDLASVLLDCQDHISGLIEALAEGEAADGARSDELIPLLSRWLDKEEGTGETGGQPATGAGEAKRMEGDVAASPFWHLSLRFAPSMLCDGMDPLKFIHYLNHYGSIRHVETIADHLPEWDAADPQQCYLGFEIALDSGASEEEIASVFAFCADNASIVILPPRSPLEKFLRLTEFLPEASGRVGEFLLACGSLTPDELYRLFVLQMGDDASPKETDGAAEAAPLAAQDKPRREEERRPAEGGSLKVPACRLDALIDRVGELVIAGAVNQAQAAKTANPSMLEAASQLLSLVEGVRDMALQLRMVAIGEVFSRFPRVVRDVAKELGKEIALCISGAEAELDKSMVDKVADPLMHLLRNAMDHGIEPVETRIARGKPMQGTVSLKAYHESGAIMIEVADDGGGLDHEKILRKAVEKGIVAEGANLSPHDIHQLILAPGFSTAERVTNLSGRGVGMDVVRSNIEALRGTLEIASEYGRGTTMRLCLPLTLAIIDGFHVGVGDAQFIVPLDMVVECLELPPDLDGLDYMDKDGVALPFVRLRQLFGERGPAHPRPRVVTVSFAGKRIGLVVDRIYGKCQTVIRPLGSLFQHVPCVTGSTILGDGEVALILDVVRLIQGVMARESQTRRGAAHAQGGATASTI
ncbi:chemotaxis protein CheA [Chromobacterium alticapitis]|uniref:Chemotaxis protein CheA n=1 Tax=Chromobacterium alticapitis TaxID=2073169 RepID=A0A2S5DGP1_9NEIS|nr:chemotaxis protein CheA [Chromobacterium alticapitis]POZ62265.1 chemotaxis protein CheA [Chromobacterium alticapitis]